ncbi:hypothetical protein ERUR111494_04705 [Erysipelothrix urinaevulpis]|uniref:hypothetical protein n=1 Tax=Erysipelothrix urinaevulpis TaxID=2683717 RepID=UPI001358F73C|nr:hypothetical protein [Erysipelothrix urinaevulpis]
MQYYLVVFIKLFVIEKLLTLIYFILRNINFNITKLYARVLQLLLLLLLFTSIFKNEISYEFVLYFTYLQLSYIYFLCRTYYQDKKKKRLYYQINSSVINYFLSTSYSKLEEVDCYDVIEALKVVENEIITSPILLNIGYIGKEKITIWIIGEKAKRIHLDFNKENLRIQIDQYKNGIEITVFL